MVACNACDERGTSLIQKPKPLIGINQARKLLGETATNLTNAEIEALLFDCEQMIRLLVKQHLVRKSERVTIES